MSKRMNWSAAAKRDAVRNSPERRDHDEAGVYVPRITPPKRDKLTGKQANYLGVLCKRAGVKYTGRGLTRAEASAEIDRLQSILRSKTPE